MFSLTWIVLGKLDDPGLRGVGVGDGNDGWDVRRDGMGALVAVEWKALSWGFGTRLRC